MKVAVSLYASNAVFRSGDAAAGQPEELELGVFEFDQITAAYGWLTFGEDRNKTIAVFDSYSGYWVVTKTTPGPRNSEIETPDSSAGKYSDLFIRPVEEVAASQ